jgi:hypothetical protein
MIKCPTLETATTIALDKTRTTLERPQRYHPKSGNAKKMMEAPLPSWSFLVGLGKKRWWGERVWFWESVMTDALGRGIRWRSMELLR